MSPQVRRSTGLAVRCASGVAATSVTTSSAHAAGVTPTNGSNGTNGSSHASAASAATAATATLSGRTSCSRLGRLGLLRTHQPSRPSSSLRSQARRIITLSLSPASSAPLSTSPFSTRACFSTAAVYSSSTSLSHLASSPSPSSSPSSPSSSTTPDLGSNIASVRCVLLHLAPVRSRIRTLPVIMGSALKQTRDHGDHGHGHSHSGHGHHHHHHDNTYLTSANTSDPGVRITRLGLLSNLGMAIAKFIGGWAFNSRSMTADAWHSIADLTSDILTLATLSWSLKRPSDRFPMGFGKVESLGSLGVSGMLLVGGFYMGWESAISLYGHFNPEGAHHIFEHIGHGHSHSHSPVDLGIPNIHAVWLAAGTILIKEWLYHATMKVALERKSSVLASNAVHHRVDSLTGIVTLAAILGANVFEHAAWLDPVGGLLISIMVVNAGYENTKEALYELADRSLDDEVKKSVRKQAHRALANVSEGHEAELRDVSGIKSGQNYLVDLELAVPGAWTVNDVKDVEDAVRLQIGSKVRGVRRLRVRFVSRDEPVKEKWDEFIAGSEALQKPEGQEKEEEEEEEEEEGGGSNRH